MGRSAAYLVALTEHVYQERLFPRHLNRRSLAMPLLYSP